MPPLGFGFAPGLTTAAKAARIAIMLGVIALLLLLSYCQGRTDGSNSVKLADERAKSALYQRGLKAGEAAAEQRLADQRRQLKAEKKYEEVIAASPGGRNSPASVAVGCERLRRAGYSGSDLPAECGPSGGNRGKAAAVAGDRD
jgi:hypothetical protein